MTAYTAAFINDICASNDAATLKRLFTSPSLADYGKGLGLFKNIIKNGAPWDFKVYITSGPPKYSLTARTSGCPKGKCGDCNVAVTMCGACFDLRMLGNIIFGYVGMYLGLTPGALQFGATLAYMIAHNTDQPNLPDQRAAITAGIDAYNSSSNPPISPQQLCSGISSNTGMSIYKHCKTCGQTWSNGFPADNLIST